MGENISTRVTYGLTLEEFGGRDNVYIFDAGLKSCTMIQYFSEECPGRFSSIDIVEANMTDIAADSTTCGAVSLVYTFAVFAVGHTYDQIRNSMTYLGLSVKVIGNHAGLIVGEGGASHRYIEDISLIRTVPRMTVVMPCDSRETHLAAKAVLEYEGPCYLRTSRYALDYTTDNFENYKFEVGKGVQLADGTDVTIIACGLMVQESLRAEKVLETENMNARVIDMHTIKPIDRGIIIKAAKETEAIVTAEKYDVIGGLGSSVSEVIVGTEPTPIEFIGVEDKFGHSGAPKKLLESFGLIPEHVIVAAKQAVQRRR